jgi:hypothetical protein
MTIQFLVMGFEKPGMTARAEIRTRKTEGRFPTSDLRPRSDLWTVFAEGKTRQNLVKQASY